MPIYLVSPTAKNDTMHLPVIQFTLLDVVLDFNHCDVLMFTSKQAVLSAEALNPQWKEVPCLAIGSATAKQIKELGGSVLYQPENFYAKTLAKDIIKKFKEKRILYLRPKIVSFDSKDFLEKSGLTLDERVIYETSCVKYESKDKPEKNAIIIFTSPSTIYCFLENFSWDTSYTAVVIGKATQVYLPSTAKCEIADAPLISSCIEKAKQILTANKL
jgi:uroporphyrinogen-III synthase